MVKAKQRSDHIGNLVETFDILRKDKMKLNLAKCIFGVSSAMLNRFLSRSIDRCKPFFKRIERAQRDTWDDECERAFQDLKKYLTSSPLLSKLEAAEDLYIYLAVLEVAVSYTLIREELRAQLPIFYIFKALLDEETRYPKIKKLILELVVTARKHKPYVHAYIIIIITQYLLRSI
ncbi:hypothetical protein ACFXTH_041005 [Malus domestica]